MFSPERVRTLRKTKKLSQSQLAEMIGVSRSAVFEWERGGYIPDGNNLSNLAKGLGVPVSFLLGEPEQQTKLSDDTNNTGKDKLEENESINLDAIYSILSSIRAKAKETKHEDRVIAAQILKWAIEELEATEVERLNEQRSDGVAG